MDNLQTTKSTLARLLATENLNIDIRKAETASFNPKTRTLTLPLWENTSSELYDLLVGHEVGHALDTPAEGWHDAVMDNMKPGFKSFLNVVEDARIERKIKTRYPGIRKSFGIGYRELNERDFFSIKGKDINDFLLIDRINIHFKLGVSADVHFNAEEQYFIDKVGATETFEDVYQVAKELYEYCKQEMKDKLEQEPQPQPGEPGDSEDSESDMGDPFQDDSDGDGQSSGGNQMDEMDQDGNDGGSDDGEDEKNGEDSSDITSGKDSGANDTKVNPLTSYDPKSVTDESFQNKVKDLSSTAAEIFTGKIPKTTAFEPFVSWKELINRIAYEEEPGKNMRFLKDFEAKNKNALMYLVKEFEMRKKAAELRRVSVAQTGQLDTNKLHTYKFNDDIFRRVANVSQGKNHGLFLVLDWSGSMADHLKGTVEQLITLTQFCKKVGVPFEVVAFSSEYGKINEQITTYTPDEISLENTRLLNFLSSTMPDRVYRKQCADMLAAVSGRVTINDRALGLGSTPLNTTIMILPKYINAFRAKHRLQIVNTVFLTDGEDAGGLRVYGENGRIKHYLYTSAGSKGSIIIDQDTKKTYKVPARQSAITITLLKILKDKTGCNLIGFYITNNYRSNFANVMAHLTGDVRYNRYNDADFLDDQFRNWKEDKVSVVNNWGFDEYYIIPGGSSLRVKDDDLDELVGESKATARKLRGAFLKMNQNRLTNRVLLKKFIERVS